MPFVRYIIFKLTKISLSDYFELPPHVISLILFVLCFAVSTAGASWLYCCTKPLSANQLTIMTAMTKTSPTAIPPVYTSVYKQGHRQPSWLVVTFWKSHLFKKASIIPTIGRDQTTHWLPTVLCKQKMFNAIALTDCLPNKPRLLQPSSPSAASISRTERSLQKRRKIKIAWSSTSTRRRWRYSNCGSTKSREWPFKVT